MNLKSAGYTLVEIMMVTAIMTVVTGALFAISIALGDTATVQEVKIVNHDEARRAMVALSPQVRNAARASVNWTGLPGPELRYRVAQDIDGNGSAVNEDGHIELSPERVVQRDAMDLNHDGFSNTQLIMTEGETITVLANELSPATEALGPDDVFGPAQDTDGNGRVDCGFWVTAEGEGLRLTVQTRGSTRAGQPLSTELSALLVPRN